MIRNAMTIKKRSFESIYLLTGFVVLIVAALFVLSFTNTAFTQGIVQGKGPLTGEVIAVDSGHHLRTLTLQSSSIGQYPNDELNIFLSQNTKVKICGMREPAKDVAVSRNATIRYHEVAGLAVADSVAERC